MCGFAGILTSRPMDPCEAPVDLARMTDRIAHRGPDDSSYMVDPAAGFAMGFRRLSIIDLSTSGRQPMRSASGRYSICFNGEIYNHGQLRSVLLDLGHSFVGSSDTEVVLAAFEEWGLEASLSRFIGMFAIGLWDHDRRTLQLIRDRLGIKPLYVQTGEDVLFASELSALEQHPAFDRSLSQQALRLYLRYLWIPAPLTAYRHTRKVMPGEILTVEAGAEPPVRSRRYWDLRSVARNAMEDRKTLSPKDALERLDALLVDSVKLRLRSDVPLGAFLSGGIDSSLIVAVMAEASATSPQTFTIAFDSGQHDESRHAQAVASFLGTRHTSLEVSGDVARGLVPRMPALLDEPLADPSFIPTFFVSQLARSNVTAALSGDGGDELFLGYNRYRYGGRMIPLFHRVPAPLRRGLSTGAGNMLTLVQRAFRPGTGRSRSGGHPTGSRLERARKIAALAAEGSPAAMYDVLLAAGLGPEVWPVGGRQDDGPVRDLLDQDFPEDFMDRMPFVDQLTYLPDDLLAKVDRASMANSLEVRVPLLDHRIVELSWKMSAGEKLTRQGGKAPLRTLLSRRVPRELWDRPKTGFSPPIAQWLETELKEWAGDSVSHESLVDGYILPPETVRRLRDRFHRGERHLALGLWATALLGAWLGARR